MELQDTYATVYGNTVTVNNTAGYHANYCAYGISYCQNTYNNPHYYNIHNNNVTIINGDYAVYLLAGSTGSVMDNSLKAIGNGTKTGDSAVSAQPPVTVDDNN